MRKVASNVHILMMVTKRLDLKNPSAYFLNIVYNIPARKWLISVTVFLRFWIIQPKFLSVFEFIKYGLISLHSFQYNFWNQTADKLFIFPNTNNKMIFLNNNVRKDIRYLNWNWTTYYESTTKLLSKERHRIK